MKKDSIFAKTMKLTAFLGCILCVVFALLYHYHPIDWLLTLTIAAGTTGYHFLIRLILGYFVAFVFKGKLDPNNHWFRPKHFEHRLYRMLRVRRWKKKMPTYDPDSFSFDKYSIEQIIQNSCVAELVHEWIVLASFLPLLASRWWGAFPVFLITSLLSAGLDCCFIIMQRYNRPRLQQYLKRCTTQRMTDGRQQI